MAGRGGGAVRKIRRVNETILAHDLLGSGPAIVLLHSTVCDRRMWDKQFGALAEAGYRVVRCDFRGYGDTPAPDRPHNDADDVLALLDHLGVERFSLVGSSYGGRVALEVAARWPDRVNGMVLLCAGMPGHEPSAELREFWRREEELLERGDVAGAVELNVDNWLGPQADDETRDLVRAMQRRAFDVQSAAAEEFEPIAVEVDLAAIGEIPVLAAWGAKDLPDFRQIAEHLVATLPNAWSSELSEAAHLPSLEQPTQTWPVILGFLQHVFHY
jgi:3-oxoadipate enol-lactonase